MGLSAALALIAGAVLASLAGAGTPRPPAASAYRLSLRIFGGRFVGSASENPIAVDRHGNTYVFWATRMQQGSIPSPDAPEVEELSPAARKIRSFPTTITATAADGAERLERFASSIVQQVQDAAPRATHQTGSTSQHSILRATTTGLVAGVTPLDLPGGSEVNASGQRDHDRPGVEQQRRYAGTSGGA